jgi:hypothetical protein
MTDKRLRQRGSDTQWTIANRAGEIERAQKTKKKKTHSKLMMGMAPSSVRNLLVLAFAILAVFHVAAGQPTRGRNYDAGEFNGKQTIDGLLHV